MTCINISRTGALLALTASVFLTGCASKPATQGMIGGKLGVCPASPNCVSSYSISSSHKIAPMRYSIDDADAMKKLKAILAKRNDTTIINEQENYLRVEFKTRFLGFVDDAEFLVQNGVIELRSASRVGYSDLGKNRSRMEEIRTAFEACCD